MFEMSKIEKTKGRKPDSYGGCFKFNLEAPSITVGFLPFKIHLKNIAF